MTKIIAELGVNWQGDLSIAKDMILRSKRAGADFVKFQLFNYEIIKDSKYKDELSNMIIDYSKLNELRGYAFQQHIGFGVSCMYPEAFDIIRKIGVPVDFIKIREKDHCNVDIARPAVKYCDEVDILLLISTERYISEDDYFRYNLYHTKHAKYLYCISKYPPELNEINERYISGFYFDGLSNHFPSKYLPMIAVARNLEYVEIHVKRSTKIGILYTPGLQIDENVSIDFEDLEEVCNLKIILEEMRMR